MVGVVLVCGELAQLNRLADERLDAQMADYGLAPAAARHLAESVGAVQAIVQEERQIFRKGPLEHRGQVDEGVGERFVAEDGARFVFFAPLYVKVQDVGVFFEEMGIGDAVVQAQVGEFAARLLAWLDDGYFDGSERALAHLELDGEYDRGQVGLKA